MDETQLSFLAYARETASPKFTLEMAVAFAGEGLGTLDRIGETAQRLRLRVEKVLEYCLKLGKSTSLRDWMEYLDDARKIGLDLTKESNSLPKDMYKRHANIIQQIKYRHDKELEEKLKATLAVRNKIFCWKGKKYCIRPAGSTEELVAEGKALHHCVGGYAERHGHVSTAMA